MSNSQTVKVLIALVILELLGAGVWYTLYSPSPAIAPSLEILPLKGAKAELSLKPKQAEVTVGESFEAEVFLSQEKAKLLGVDVVLTYEPAKVSVEEVVLEKVFPETPPVQIKEAEGKIFITTYAKEGKEIEGEVKLATLKLKAKVGGETKLDFQFSRGETTDSNALDFESRKDILDKAEGAVYTVR